MSNARVEQGRVASDGKPGRDAMLWAALLLAAAVRAALVVAYPKLIIWNDESLHYIVSVVAAGVEQQVLGHWPPAYEVFLGAIFKTAGPSIVAARWVQVVLSTATVFLVYGLAANASGRRAARFAGFACALYPSLVAYSHYLYSETLFIFLLLAALYVYFRKPAGPSVRAAALAGFLFGLTILTRSAVLYFLPLWLAWLALGRRWSEVRRAAVVVAVAFATLAPWSVRNSLSYGEFIPVDATLGRTILWAYNETPFRVDLGFARIGKRANRKACESLPSPRREAIAGVAELRKLFPPDQELDERTAKRLLFELSLVRDYAVRDLGAMNRCEVAHALEFIAEKPAITVQRILGRIYVFWGPNSFLLRSVHFKSYAGGVLGKSAYRWVKAVVLISYVAVVLSALLALARKPRGLLEWIVLYTLFTTAIHAAAVSSSRYRLPLMPLLIVLGSTWLARPQLPEDRKTGAGIAILGVAFLVLCVHYVWTVLP